MAKKTAAKGSETKPKSNRGGARPGSGRKPTAVKEIRDALVAGLIAPTPPPGAIPGAIPVPPPANGKSVAERAMDLLTTVIDGEYPIDVKLRAAKEVLDRVIGKPRQAVEIKGELDTGPQVIVYMPDNGRDGGDATDA